MQRYDYPTDDAAPLVPADDGTYIGYDYHSQAMTTLIVAMERYLADRSPAALDSLLLIIAKHKEGL